MKTKKLGTIYTSVSQKSVTNVACFNSLINAISDFKYWIPYILWHYMKKTHHSKVSYKKLFKKSFFFFHSRELNKILEFLTLTTESHISCGIIWRRHITPRCLIRNTLRKGFFFSLTPVSLIRYLNSKGSN